MARRFLREQNITLGLSLVLFVFMFLPTFLILVAVILFFGLAWPRLRGSNALDREQGVKDQQPETKQVSHGVWLYIERYYGVFGDIYDNNLFLLRIDALKQY
ncbi:hypothetical protein N7499_008042 [Penicillium canescens]|nr:hypothetical protein N7499_008042 [Penicillium canescens]KAJ6158373.1 hypothetical protein N7485_011199 [Penicillium canescens]